MKDKQIFIFCRGLGEANLEDEEIAAEDEEDMGVIETYSNYMPSKLKVNFTRNDYRNINAKRNFKSSIRMKFFFIQVSFIAYILDWQTTS